MDEAATAYVLERADKVKKPALVLDIDETSLSNWERIRANDFAYFPEGSCDQLPKGPCGGPAFDAMARATVIGPALKVVQEASAHHVAIFFITGRAENERAATDKNLIIPNIGDQPSDLTGDAAERTFLLPDPFYRIP